MRFFTSATFLILTILSAIPARSQVEIYSDQNRYLLGDATQVEVDLSFGEVQVEGIDGSEIIIDFRLTCNRKDLDKCKRRGERIRVVPRVKRKKFMVKLSQTPRGKIQGLNGHVKLQIPKDLPIEVDLLAGDVFVSRMLSGIDISGGGGDVDVVASHDRIGDVRIQVVAGKAELWLGDGHLKGAGFPRAIRWQGPGSSRIEIDLGTGDARVRLE